MKNFWKDLKKPFTILAPMEDVTDVVFREIVDYCGRPDVFFTEFTNVEGMNSKKGREHVVKRLIKNKTPSPIVAQIWGKNPENYAKSAKDILEMGFEGIDINMGCPAGKVVKNGTCSGLIDNPTLAGEIIAATKEGSQGLIPVSVKTRCGIRDWKTEEWAGFLLEQGIEALTIHGRIAKEMSRFPARWEEIKKVVAIKNQMGLDTVIIGNGDVLSLDEVNVKHNLYGVDGVMIGRGVFQDPYVFNPNKSIYDQDLKARLELLWKHAKLFVDTWDNRKNFVILRRFFKIYLLGLPNTNELKDKFLQTENLEEVEKLMKELG
jgi:tRNA-dihydrouridine synthase